MPSAIHHQSAPLTVAPIHSADSLAVAEALPPQSIDLVEIRADALTPGFNAAMERIASLDIPSILTARGPEEGGANDLSPAARSTIYLDWMHLAAAIDIELLHAPQQSDAIALAKQSERSVILSFHDFTATPPLKELQKKHALALEAGADIFKIATHTATPDDLACLHRFTVEAETPISVMGMGSLGMISRLLLAQAGSRLNYGYLAAPNASGQWPATTLKQRIAELTTDR